MMIKFLNLILLSSLVPISGLHAASRIVMKQEQQLALTLEQDIPKEAHSWEADIHLVNFTQEQEQKVRDAVTLIKKIIASREFKERIINYTYNGKKGFVDNAGMSNEEIYQRILEGAEVIGNTSKNNAMNVELELYHQKTNTIGYTYPNTIRIWMNKKYFSQYDPVKVADNLMHEWMHKIGFNHATIWNEERDHSVPYAVGYLVEELAKKHQEAQTLSRTSPSL